MLRCTGASPRENEEDQEGEEEEEEEEEEEVNAEEEEEEEDSSVPKPETTSLSQSLMHVSPRKRATLSCFSPWVLAKLTSVLAACLSSAPFSACSSCERSHSYPDINAPGEIASVASVSSWTCGEQEQGKEWQARAVVVLVLRVGRAEQSRAE